MTLAGIRAFALRLPQATVIQQWGEVLVFKVGGKMFLMVEFEGDLPLHAGFRPPDAEFETLAQVDGMRPAPYLARAKWVQLEDMDAVSAARFQEIIRMSYAEVVSRLSAKKRRELGI